MAATVWARRWNEEEEEALSIINKDVNQIDQTDITPLVNNLEMLGIFKDENKEEGDGVTDALSIMLQLLREESAEASWLIQAQSKIDLVELCNKKQ